MGLINTDLTNFIPKDFRLSNWEDIKDDLDAIYGEAHLIVTQCIDLACSLTEQEELDDEGVNPYDEFREEFIKEVMEVIIEHNE